MIRILLVVASVILVSYLVSAQKNQLVQNTDPETILEQRGEVYFTFKVSNVKEIGELTRIISIDKIDNTTVYAYANQKEFKEFLLSGYQYKVLVPPSEMHPVRMLDDLSQREITEWDFYPTYEVYLEMMYQYEADYPALCRIEEIGTLSSGRKLITAIISDNVNERENEPQFLYTSSIHGDELTGYILMLRLIDYLLENYGLDPRITNIVDGIEIYINPLANPDGTYAGGNSTVYGATRGNANFVDLNRNYPDPEDGPHPDGNPWQPETILFMEYAEVNDFVMGANFHGGYEVINYPWDTWPTRHADNDWWIYVSYEYAETVHDNSPSNYFIGQEDGVTNGYDWYTIDGGRQDYMNYFEFCRESTIEISNTKLLPASQLPAHWDYNYQSFLSDLEQSMFGVRGIITDSLTSEPVVAKVIVENHDKDSSRVYSGAEVGNYHRLLDEGEYDITYKSKGYFPKTYNNIIVNNRQATINDVKLVPGDLIADFTSNKTHVPVGESVGFFDQSYGDITSWTWSFEGGTPATSNVQNPAVQYNETGNYSVTLTISDGTSSNTMTRNGFVTANLEYLMSSATITTNTGLFFDSGGDDANYSDNENYIMTFKPDDGCNKLRFDFVELNIEFESSCDYDWLKIYNGPSIESPLIGTYCGYNSPGTVVADNDEGALTFRFHSDDNITESGWVAEISCDGNVGINPAETSSIINIYPNPAQDWCIIESNFRDAEELLIKAFDITGKQVHAAIIDNSSNYNLDISNWERGIYYFEVLSGNERYSQKILKH